MSLTAHPSLSWLTREKRLPLVAILRGLMPQEAAAVGHALVESGFTALEVPLNRPGALQCIELLARTMPTEVLVGGGTMLSVSDVDAVHTAGGRLMVSPNCDIEVIARARTLGMLCAPGIATATEAFAALKAGAQILKLFPSEMVGLGGLKALLSVLPAGTEVFPVGGITPQSMGPWIAAGATGFGIGSQLYSPGTPASEVATRAGLYATAWNAARSPVVMG